jgi:hypothetical protein
MPDNVTNAAPPINQRPLTGTPPANAAANAPAGQPLPGFVQPNPTAPGATQAPVNQPGATQAPVNQGTPPPVAQDQYQATPGAPPPRDPQQAAVFGVYAMQLNMPSPVEVSQAIGVIENLGPAFRQDAINAVRNQLVPGQNPMKNQVLMDALVRWGDKQALPTLQRMMSDPDAGVRTTAAKAYAQMAGVAGARPDPMGNQGTPGAAPANVPAAAPGAPLDQATQIVVDGYVTRLKNRLEMATAAYEVAQLPMNQLAAVTKALCDDATFSDDRAFNLISTALAKRIKEPGAVDALRYILNRPGKLQSRDMAYAKSRAAIATLHYGTPADQAGFLKLLAEPIYTGFQLKKIMIDSLLKRPDLLSQQATIVTLGAIMNDKDSATAGIAAAHALAEAKSAFARDTLGESGFWKLSGRSTQDKLWALDWLNKHPAPYSAGTVENLRWLVANGDPQVKKKAGELLKKTGA